MAHKPLQTFGYRYLIPYGGLLLVKTIASTYRIRILDAENETRTLGKYSSVVYASWHQRFFPGIAFFSTRKPIAIMISRSRDGEFIAKIVNILGWQSVRGSSTRGGFDALRKLKRLSVKGCKIGHIVDGPQGPAGVVKPGLIKIAQMVGLPIVPVAMSPQRKWVFSSWDRFMVPKPFSRVVIRFGAPIDIPRRLDAEAFETTRQRVQRQMAALYRDTDRIWSQPDKIAEIFK